MLAIFNIDLLHTTMTRRKKIVILALLTFVALC